MRERRTFAERTKVLKSDEGKRKFFLVYEEQAQRKFILTLWIILEFIQIRIL